ncbi:HAD-like domain-containing protein [Colletotrichum godetiae]|uniref:HAD-like domain-containing protein n=1 Tax=Colletotrichum godetiae TaxID=1209918 RepID=A0AAJ0AM62_9PEZI|nr:HAD-like domain-containing protein [Colletotrichum godetiae]KAK1674968.1 HAD-like domain-containing protein [Colletotrichum godetiae]
MPGNEEKAAAQCVNILWHIYITRFLARYWEFYGQAYRNSRRVTPGSIETLLQLRGQCMRLAIVTNVQAKDQVEKAEAIGAHHVVDYMITSEEAGFCKPDTAIFQLAIGSLGFSLDESYMVGDSVESDIIGAINSGMKTDSLLADGNE